MHFWIVQVLAQINLRIRGYTEPRLEAGGGWKLGIRRKLRRLFDIDRVGEFIGTVISDIVFDGPVAGVIDKTFA